MSSELYEKLVKLDDTGETIAAESQDIRGRKVVDKNGQELGKIDALFVDDTQRKVRFMRVESGGFLGLGERKSLIPIDAITSVTAHEIQIGHTADTVASAPTYDPTLVEEKSRYNDTYRHYGYIPFWGSGYVNPVYPFYGVTD